MGVAFHFLTTVIWRWYLLLVGGPFVLDQSLRWLWPKGKEWLDTKWPTERRRPFEVVVVVGMLLISTFQAYRDEYDARQTVTQALAMAERNTAYWRGKAAASATTRSLSPSNSTTEQSRARNSERRGPGRPSRSNDGTSVNGQDIPLARPPVQPVAPAPAFVAPPPSPSNGPRSLSPDQQRFLVAALSPLSSKVSRSLIFWVPNDNETYSYSSEFQKVFIRAGLNPTWSQQNPLSPDEIGVMLEVEPDTPKDVLSSVKVILNKAGIAVKIIDRPKQDTKAQIILFVGPQPF